MHIYVHDISLDSSHNVKYFR